MILFQQETHLVWRRYFKNPLFSKTFLFPDTYQFINAGVWLSTIIFLIVSALFGLFAAGLSVWNVAANPVEAWFNIFGLYIYNGIACFSSLLVVLLWGGMFASTINNNVGILYTIIGTMDSHGMAALGYSYWYEKN